MKILHTCPICESDNWVTLYQGHTYRQPTDGKSWTVVECGHCGHGFINPQPEWADLVGYYSASYSAYEKNHGNYSIEDEKTIETARRDGQFRHLTLPIAGKALLDVGCGGGYFLRLAQLLGADVQGVEPSDAGSAQSKKQNLPVFHGMLDQFVSSESKRQFDIITANHVLEHAPDPVTTLKQMKSLLAPGGYIWISVPNADCFFSRKLQANWHSTDLPYHIHQFSPASLTLAGQLAGLSVRRSLTYSLPSAVAASIRHYMRLKFFVPQRISEHIGFINNTMANRCVRHFDQRGRGEAIIMEFH